MKPISRRRILTAGLTAAAAAGVVAADRLALRYALIPPDYQGWSGPGETLTYATQRLLTRHAMAREFSRSSISKSPLMNEVLPALGQPFKKLQAAGFSDWRVTVDGMVAHPMTLSIADLRMMPMRNQITEIACEEGWSYIAEWIGTPLSEVLREAGVSPQARYVVYFTPQAEWWESIDMADAYHPQTLLTLGMNDGDLPVGFGGPLRLRLPRQLGYKSLKYITRITVTDSMKQFGMGLGSASPETGYAWFAGI
jgi:DMSO/TMAO reductase YedYZ molybdopterin-dependent catalytic subunit